MRLGSLQSGIVEARGLVKRQGLHNGFVALDVLGSHGVSRFLRTTNFNSARHLSSVSVTRVSLHASRMCANRGIPAMA